MKEASLAERRRIDPAPCQAAAPRGADLVQQVVREHGPYVWRTVRALGVPLDDVPDVCQEVFLAIHRKLDGFEGRSALTTWIFAVCLRRVRAYQRTAARRRERPCDPMPEETAPADQIEAMSRRERQTLLLEAIGALKPREREAFVLHEIEGLSMAEVQEALDCPLRTAYALRDRARRSIRRFWQKASRQGRVAP